MDQNNSVRVQVQSFVLRSYALFLILVFLFISNFLETYHFKAWLNKPFIEFTICLTRLASHFLERPFTGNLQFRDYYWTHVALLLYLAIAIIIAFVWTIRDKGKASVHFISYAWVFARYYLAAILLGYGISKLLGNQFGQPDTSALIRPLGGFDSRSLFWEFMGASKSYQIFSGVLEIIAGALLLFRRTTTMGCLVALPIFINILMLDIAYDVFVKIRLVYFALLVIFVLIPDLKRLFAFFVLRQATSLSVSPPIVKNSKYKRAQLILKFCFISLIVFLILRKQIEVYPQYHYPIQGNIAGVYIVNQFYLNNQLRQPANNDSVSWSKIAINSHFPILAVKLMNDSIADYAFKTDTAKNFIDLMSYGKPQIKFRLNYIHTKANEWIFEGVCRKDSIRVVSTKISGKKFNLQKGYGRVIWDYDF